MGAAPSSPKPPYPHLLLEWRRCTLAQLTESMNIHQDVLGGRESLTFAEFDEVFGHVLSDTEEHFGVFRTAAPRSSLLMSEQLDRFRSAAQRVTTLRKPPPPADGPGRANALEVCG